jgi:hypothetical protein
VNAPLIGFVRSQTKRRSSPYVDVVVNSIASVSVGFMHSTWSFLVGIQFPLIPVILGIAVFMMNNRKENVEMKKIVEK